MLARRPDCVIGKCGLDIEGLRCVSLDGSISPSLSFFLLSLSIHAFVSSISLSLCSYSYHSETSGSSEWVTSGVICIVFIDQCHFYQFTPDWGQGMFRKLEKQLFVMSKILRQFYVNFIAVNLVNYFHIYIKRLECSVWYH